uniref:Uncharacterized protein n=1 Tax=Gopherus evgoodei TaxID=1825980 RepID=A0A8C4YDA9_9SAUR
PGAPFNLAVPLQLWVSPSKGNLHHLHFTSVLATAQSPSSPHSLGQTAFMFSSIKQRDHRNVHLQIPLLQGCAVQKNKSHVQLGFRSLTSKGNLVRDKVTSTLAPSHSTSSWASRTRHEKMTVAVSRKIAPKKLAKAVKILRKVTMPMQRKALKSSKQDKANVISKARAKKVTLRKK